MTDTDKKTPARKTATTKESEKAESATETAASDAPATQAAEMAHAGDHEDSLEHHDHDLDLHAAADKIVRRNIYWALGFGVVPLPIADMFTIGAVQLKMMKELADLYDVPFSKNLATAAAVSIVGGVGPVELAKGLGASVVKLIPGAGSVAGIAALPITAGALTYVIGHILVKHFESGGTFCSFDASKVKGYSKDLYAKGKGMVSRMKKDKEADVSVDADETASAAAPA
ncbi:MAG: YcjF family protein [Terasakiella sp.]|uniref:YcjF family protein n=1 Tax=unclassified Terasakiella TaxID=2614952 RepID=UPI003B00F677